MNKMFINFTLKQGPRGYPGPGGIKGDKGEPANVDWTNYEKGQKGEVRN
jgi:hypothetical protein